MTEIDYYKGMSLWHNRSGKAYEIWELKDDNYVIRWTNSKGKSVMIEQSKEQLDKYYTVG